MEMSIDTASSLASIALSAEGRVTSERTWVCERNHTVELMPAVDRLLRDGGISGKEIRAVFVSTGPGMYTGLRVGVSVAKGLAYALEVPIAGVGRLEADAYSYRGHGGEVIAVHAAGRGDYAWGAYRCEPWEEVSAPRLDKAEVLATRAAATGALVVGEVDGRLRAAIEAAGGAQVRDDAVGRAAAVAELGWIRLAAGKADEVALLAPVYLRPPAIGPQRPAGQ